MPEYGIMAAIDDVIATLQSIAKSQGASADAALVARAVANQLGPDAMSPHRAHAQDIICEELLALLSQHHIDYTEADVNRLRDLISKALAAQALS